MTSSILVSAAILLGVGMGAFIDGILLHQIFQVHSMLSAKIPVDTVVNVKVNMVWDGFFHLLAWATTLVGLIALFKAGTNEDRIWSGEVLAGGMFIGWGLFNFVEGLIDHHIVGIHHVVERLGLSQYDYLFLSTGPVFIFIGWYLVSKKRVPKKSTNVVQPK